MVEVSCSTLSPSTITRCRLSARLNKIRARRATFSGVWPFRKSFRKKAVSFGFNSILLGFRPRMAYLPFRVDKPRYHSLDGQTRNSLQNLVSKPLGSRREA